MKTLSKAFFLIVLVAIFLIAVDVNAAALRDVTAIGEAAYRKEKKNIERVIKEHDFTKIPPGAVYKEGQLMVRFTPDSNGKSPSISNKKQILAALGGGTIEHNYELVSGLSLVKLPPGMTVEKALKKFNGKKSILYAKPDYQVSAMYTPHDEYWGYLWGMRKIEADEAWDITTGSNEIIVAVIDTGVDFDHPDLAANMWVNEREFPHGCDNNDDDVDPYKGYVDDIYGWNFSSQAGSYCDKGHPYDDYEILYEDGTYWLGHGTLCAGIIAAVGDNYINGHYEGIAGVSWNAKIMAIKFLDENGEGSVSGAISAIQYSVKMGADLSNNSWGLCSLDPDDLDDLRDAIAATATANMLFIAAAGNGSKCGVQTIGIDNDSDPGKTYPASFDLDNIISVMATNDADEKAGFSNFGATSVDLAAPGVNIFSTSPQDSYEAGQGTSFAAPYVAGACALVWSINPQLTNSEVKEIVLNNVDIPSTPLVCVSHGRLNVHKAVCAARIPWVDVEPSEREGFVSPAGSNNIEVKFSSESERAGTNRDGFITITFDDIYGTELNIPVTLNVPAE